jgi:pilus assembly protein CpaB
MNAKRVVMLFFAAGAAGVVALMVRNVVGGGSKTAEAHVAAAPVEISEVLVAATRIEAGKPVNAAQVRWQSWPAKIIDPSFIRKSSGQSPAAIVDGSVARAPMVEGEPITYTKIVKSQSAGFMAATLGPGMRAVAISVSVASVAGGFILPNNRIDLLLTMVTGDNPKRGVTKLVLSNVRILAIDQASDDKNQKAVSDVKTVTLELTPEQTRTVAQAQAMGSLSLALRGLGDEDAVVATNTAPNGMRKVGPGAKAAAAGTQEADGSEDGVVTVLRYGKARKDAGGAAQ